MESFYIACIDGERQVRGDRVTVGGLECFEHERHKEDKGNSLYLVSELSTGMTIGKGDTPEQALCDALYKLDKYGLESARDRVKNYKTVNA